VSVAKYKDQDAAPRLDEKHAGAVERANRAIRAAREFIERSKKMISASRQTVQRTREVGDKALKFRFRAAGAALPSFERCCRWAMRKFLRSALAHRNGTERAAFLYQTSAVASAAT
jgi:hypothetical protein